MSEGAVKRNIKGKSLSTGETGGCSPAYKKLYRADSHRRGTA
jgi:hypothetical protein